MPGVAPLVEHPAQSRRKLGLPLIVGIFLVLSPIIASLVGRLFVSRHGVAIFAYQPVLRPSSAHLLGTDGQGRDMVANLTYGLLPTFEIGLLAALVAVAVGTILGVVSGYVGGTVDGCIRGVTDVMLCIPGFAILVVAAALWGSLSVSTLGLMIALLSWPLAARAVRSQILSSREGGYVVMNKLSNRSAAAIMFLEILPNILPYIMATFVGLVAGSLLTAVGLQLIGLGPIGVITLGSTLQSALAYGALSQGLWWWWAPPAAVLVLLFLGLFLVSLSVDRISNRRLVHTS
jgi:peptide/nickel transport system permease protein